MRNDGSKIGKYPLIGHEEGGAGSTISVLNDSTFVIGGRWEEDIIPFPGHCLLFLTDTVGNIIKKRTLFDELLSPRNTIITFDNKIMACCTFYPDGNWDTYLYKLNDSLQEDTLYNVQLTYDSLCPNNIVSDTITLNCGIWVNTNEPYTTKEGSKLIIYPNPATDKINIQLPDILLPASKR